MPPPIRRDPGPADETVVARFLLMGRHCVVVPARLPPAKGCEAIGRLTLNGHSFEVRGVLESHAASDPVERLTSREFEIAMLIAAGCCNKAIGRRLGISAHTVGAHVGRIFAKLNVHKRAELMARMAHRLLVNGESAASWLVPDSS